MADMWTAKDKLQCVERELKYREVVFPRRVADKKMTEKQAERELDIMRSIADDYRQQLEMERLL
jgi:hypothetical protein